MVLVILSTGHCPHVSLSPQLKASYHAAGRGPSSLPLGFFLPHAGFLLTAAHLGLNPSWLLIPQGLSVSDLLLTDFVLRFPSPKEESQLTSLNQAYSRP